MFNIEPIGYFHSTQQDKYAVPRQSNLVFGNQGTIVLNSGHNFEQALEGLQEFDRIWVLFYFHRNKHWKPKVLPPRGNQKRGVFATRSPHRPNFIGLSCVKIKEIQGLKITVIDHDLIDGTPILDIKPYLDYADSFVSEKQGWLEKMDSDQYFVVNWLEEALKQINYLKNEWQIDLQQQVEELLSFNPFPYPNKRIKKLENENYELAYKTWRIYYYIVANKVTISKIKSGYDNETLEGKRSSKWNDVPVHLAFVNLFNKGELNE